MPCERGRAAAIRLRPIRTLVRDLPWYNPVQMSLAYGDGFLQQNLTGSLPRPLLGPRRRPHMKISRPWREVIMNDLDILILLALARILLHTLTNGQYGFHRDELAMLDDARYLAWGYVAYPPVTPLIARVALDLFGPSLIGVRFFSALAQSVAMVLTGLMARELDGSRSTQALVALAVAIAPLSLAQGALFQYVSFDYLWWVLIAYLMIRLLKSEGPRWWLGIGATIGLGMMTKYTMAFYLAGIIAGVVCTKARRYLASPWLWGGVALSLLVFLPNLMWQVQHDFIS